MNNNNNNDSNYFLLQNNHLLQENKDSILEEEVPNKLINKNLEFPIDDRDILFTLTINPSIYKENVSNLITKLVVIRELSYINLDDLSKVLAIMGIKELNIFFINDELEKIKIVKRNNGCSIYYAEIKPEDFSTLLRMNKEKADFLDYNKNSLYILRDGNFLLIKNLFAQINGYEINVGRGGSQKAHVLSPLDLRLSSYLLAMYNCNYTKLRDLNAFNVLEKDRYLSYKDTNNYKNLNIRKTTI